jgi:hypothetical protein
MLAQDFACSFLEIGSGKSLGVLLEWLEFV